MNVVATGPSKRRLAAIVFAVVSVVTFTRGASAQLPQARLHSIFPPGAQSGSTVELALTGGDDLDGAERLVFDHPGIEAVPKMRGEGDLRRRVPDTFLVTVGEDVPAGRYEVRAVGLFGMTNPRAFVVGTRAESIEAESNDRPEQATEIELESVTNGVINGSTDVDHYRFNGRQGQRVLASCSTNRIDSRLDAALELFGPGGRRLGYAYRQGRRDPLVDVTLPQDGAYLLKVYDFAYDGSDEHVYRLEFHTGPQVDYVMPPCGVPGETALLTLFGRNLGGEESDVTVDGRRLEQRQVEVTFPERDNLLECAFNVTSIEATLDGFSYVHRTERGAANPVRLHLARAPVVREREPNGQPEEAQTVEPPVELAGQFQKKGDVDYVSFEAKKGDVLYVDLVSQRYGTSADPYFKIERIIEKDNGETEVDQIVEQDDIESAPQESLFETRSDDAAYRFEAPEDGTYRLALRDLYSESRGDPRLVYHVSIRPPQPDFRLVAVPIAAASLNGQGAAVPWSLGVRRGGSGVLKIIALRRDGFDGPIDLNVAGLPAGVSAPDARIGEGRSTATLIVRAENDTAPWAGSIQVLGQARLGEGKAARYITRSARPGTTVWEGEQNTPAFSRAANSLGLAVLSEEAPFELRADVSQVRIQQGQRVEIPLKLIRNGSVSGNLNLAANGLPGNANVKLSTEEVEPDARLSALGLIAAGNARPGRYELDLTAEGKVTYRHNPALAERLEADLAAVDEKAQHAAEAAETAQKEHETLSEQASKQQEAVEQAAALHNAAEKKAAEAKKTMERVEAAASRLNELIDRLNRAESEGTVAKKLLDEVASPEAPGEEGPNKETKPSDPTVDNLRQEIESALKQTAQSAKEAEAAHEQIESDLEVARDRAKSAQEQLAEAASKLERARKTAAAFAKARDAAGRDAKKHQALAEAAQEYKRELGERLKEAAERAKPEEIDVVAPVAAILLDVRRAPVELTVNEPEDGALARGDELDVAVSVKRVNDFEGPVTLSLALPPGATGLFAEPVIIPADATEGRLRVRAAAGVSPGERPGMRVQAVAEFDGRAVVNEPLNLKIVESKPAQTVKKAD